MLIDEGYDRVQDFTCASAEDVAIMAEEVAMSAGHVSETAASRHQGGRGGRY